jgi:hypothetical protein
VDAILAQLVQDIFDFKPKALAQSDLRFLGLFVANVGVCPRLGVFALCSLGRDFALPASAPQRLPIAPSTFTAPATSVCGGQLRNSTAIYSEKFKLAQM